MKNIFKNTLSLVFLFFVSCDFKSPTKFEMPTWFFDLSFPLVQKKLSLEGMIDSATILPYGSKGMKFEYKGSMPPRAIDLSQLLSVKLLPPLPDIKFQPPKFSGIPAIAAPGGISGLPFYFGQVVKNYPKAIAQSIPASNYNDKPLVNTTIFDTLALPVAFKIPSSTTLPEFIKSVDGFVIKPDGTPPATSQFKTYVKNDGIPTAIEGLEITLLTKFGNTYKVLAEQNNTNDILKTDLAREQSSFLGGKTLGDSLFIAIRYKIKASSSTLTVPAGDKMLLTMQCDLTIAGFDGLLATLKEYQIKNNGKELSYKKSVPVPSSFAIASGDTMKSKLFWGELSSSAESGTNKINIKDISNNFPFDIKLDINFKNFKSPNNEPPVRIDTTLKKGTSLDSVLNLAGYRFASHISSDSALNEMAIDILASIPSQSTIIPFGTDIGPLAIEVSLPTAFSFDSIGANLDYAFKSEAIPFKFPQGLSDAPMQFANSMLELRIKNSGSSLPINLVFEMKAMIQDTVADSLKINQRIKYPAILTDTATTTVKIPDGSGGATLDDLISLNPDSLGINPLMKIDGRGVVSPNMSFGIEYDLIVPLIVKMIPTTIISGASTPVVEMDHSNRYRIRNTLKSSKLFFLVKNSTPFSGKMSMLLSNLDVFPTDASRRRLDEFININYEKKNWAKDDIIRVINSCDELSPLDTNNIFIFNVFSDSLECVDDLTYLVKRSASGGDTLISYIDTILSMDLPFKGGEEYGTAFHTSELTPDQLRLMTNPVLAYMTPSFYFSGSNGMEVAFETDDFIEIESRIELKLSSSGMTSKPPNEIIIKYPNGGETINKDSTSFIKWKFYGVKSKVDIAFSVKSNPDISNENDWISIQKEVASVDSISWTPKSFSPLDTITGTKRDSVRIRIQTSDKKTTDMSGWYFSIR